MPSLDLGPETFLERYDAAEPWLRRALPFLEANETEYGLQWRLARRMMTGSPHYHGVLGFCWTRDKEVVGIGFQTLPFHKMIVSLCNAVDAQIVASQIVPIANEARCIQGPAAGLALVRRELRASGQHSTFGTGQWLYRLDEVRWPRDPVGSLVQTRLEHHTAFFQSAAEGFSRETQIGADVDDTFSRIKQYGLDKRLFVLKVDEQPVCCAVLNHHSPRSKCIGFVYTPPELRSRGYASNLVALLSQQALDDGAAFCTLYTESTNPTSNKIYQQVGYKLVAKHDELWLGECAR